MMLVPWAIASCLLSVTFALSCYLPDGSAPTFNQMPCDPSAAVSTCCDTPDYCLSNGLCLNAGGNNLLSLQGCTDPTWPAPCHKYCAGTQSISIGYNIIPCPNTENFGTASVSYCCDPGATTCCQNGSAFQIPVGTIVLRPDQVSTSMSSSPLPSFSNSLAPTTTSSSQTLVPTSGTTSSSDSKFVAIGLGVGIPVGVASICVFLWFFIKLRHQNNLRDVPAGDNIVKGSAADGGFFTTSSGISRNELDATTHVHELSERNL